MFRRIFSKSNQFGFSMLQGLVLSGVVAGTALVVIKQNEISNKMARTSQTDLAVSEVFQQIDTKLLSKKACTLSFASTVVPNGGGVPVEIKNEEGEVVFKQNSLYLNDQVLIESISLLRNDPNGSLDVVLKKVGNKDGRGIGNRAIKRSYNLNINWNSANEVIDCYSGSNNSVDEAVTRAIDEVCGSASVQSGLFKRGEGCDAIPQIHPSSLSQNYEPSVADLRCGSGEGLVGFDFNSSTQKYEKKCLKIYDLPDSCPKDSLLRRNANGVFDCVKPSCQFSNQIFRGLKSNGEADCFSCSAGEVLAWKNSKWECLKMTCAPDEYLAGTGLPGELRCTKLVVNSAQHCSNSAKLVIEDGSLKLQCCDPACSGSSNICSGTNFASSNGCGVCVGTKAPDCSNANQICIGSNGPSANGCGTCDGTRPMQHATWKWVDTSETRDAGACIGGKMKTEKKQVKACDNNQACGGNGCLSPMEQWVPGPDKNCTPACTPTCPLANTMCKEDSFYGDNGCGGYCNVTGSRACKTVCNTSGTKISACTNPNSNEVNLGNITAAACATGCLNSFNQRNIKGCWIKVNNAYNKNCYCRKDGEIWPNAAENSTGNTCSRVFAD